jgi:hypothetical protein
MTTQQLIQLGKKEIKETDDALKRSEKIVNETIQVAQVMRVAGLVL